MIDHTFFEMAFPGGHFVGYVVPAEERLWIARVDVSARACGGTRGGQCGGYRKVVCCIV